MWCLLSSNSHSRLNRWYAVDQFKRPPSSGVPGVTRQIEALACESVRTERRALTKPVVTAQSTTSQSTRLSISALLFYQLLLDFPSLLPTDDLQVIVQPEPYLVGIESTVGQAIPSGTPTVHPTASTPSPSRPRSNDPVEEGYGDDRYSCWRETGEGWYQSLLESHRESHALQSGRKCGDVGEGLGVVSRF